MNEEPISERSDALPKPPELQGLALSQAKDRSGDVELSKGQKERQQGSNGKDEDPRIFQFASMVHGYLWATVVFAEQKAAFVFAVDTAFLGYLFRTGLASRLKSSPASWHLREYLALISVVFLAGSIAVVVSVVIPRLRGDGQGLVFFNAIANRAKAATYAEEVLRSKASELDNAILRHCHELSVICARKYRGVGWAVWLGIVGFVAGLILITASS